MVLSTPQPGSPVETPSRRSPQSKTILDKKRGEKRAFHLPKRRQTHPPLSPHLSALRSGHGSLPDFFFLHSTSRKNWIFS